MAITKLQSLAQGTAGNMTGADIASAVNDLIDESAASTIITEKNKDNARWFDTVALMKAATDLSVGDSVVTKGYTAAGDGGGAEYLMVAGNTGDGFGDHDVLTTTAKLQGESDLDKMGVVWGDTTTATGTHNAAVLTHAISSLADSGVLTSVSGLDLYIGEGVSAVNAVTLSGVKIDLQCTLVHNDTSDGIEVGRYDDSSITIKGIKTLSAIPDNGTGTGFTKQAMRNCDVTIGTITGQSIGFRSDSAEADYYNNIELGRVTTSKLVGACISIGTSHYSNENHVWTKYMSGFNGVEFDSITGQTFDVFGGWKFIRVGFEGIKNIAYLPRNTRYCIMIDPRFEGGAQPDVYWVYEDNTNNRNTYHIGSILRYDKVVLQGGSKMTGHFLTSDNSSVAFSEMDAGDNPGDTVIHRGRKKETATPNYTTLEDSDLTDDLGIFERWRGYVVDGNGDLLRHGLLEPYGVNDIGAAVTGTYEMGISNHIEVSTTTGTIALKADVRREFEGFTYEVEISYFSNPISLQKSNGTVVIAEGAITGAGLYRVIYRGGTWRWSRIGDKYQ